MTTTTTTSRTLPMLRTLAGHPDGLSTPELARRHVASVRPWQQALTRCGTLMRRQEALGNVYRAGTVPGAWQQGPAVIWRITSQGRAWVAAEGRSPSARRRHEAEMRREKGTAALDGLRSAGYGPGTPVQLQAFWCPALRAVGCSVHQIADFWGVTSQVVSARLKRHPVGVLRL